MRILTACALLLLLLGAARAAQASDEEFQIWLPATLTASFNESIKGWYEVQPRIGDNASEVTQLILRTALGWQFAPRWSGWFGYAWTPTLWPRYTDENRIYEQLSFVDDFEIGRLTSRTRFEQRWIEGVSGPSLRLRTLLRGQSPFTADESWALVAQDEIFFNLNSAATNGPQAGFDQNRFFLGGAYVFDPQGSIDARYMLQIVDTAEPGFPDRVNHILGIQLWLSA